MKVYGENGTASLKKKKRVNLTSLHLIGPGQRIGEFCGVVFTKAPALLGMIF